MQEVAATTEVDGFSERYTIAQLSKEELDMTDAIAEARNTREGQMGALRRPPDRQRPHQDEVRRRRAGRQADQTDGGPLRHRGGNEMSQKYDQFVEANKKVIVYEENLRNS